MTWPSSIALYASHLTNTHFGAKKMPHQFDHISVSEYRGGRGVYRAPWDPGPSRPDCNRIAVEGIVGSSDFSRISVMGVADKRRTFRALHQSGCFVIPNPWNVGSARYLQGLGFKALATTSAGYAHSIGYSDGDVTRDMVLAHCREI